MPARMFAFLTMISLVAAPAPARAADTPKDASPTVIIRLDSINNLLEDVKYLAELAGQKDKADEGLGFVKATVEAQKIDKAIDFTRPLGMYGTVNPDNPLDSAGVLLVPVSDEKALLDLLEGFQFKAEKGEDDVYMVQAPFPPIPIYFRFAHKYAYITAQNKASVAKESILEPTKVLSAAKASTFSAVFRLDRIPDDMKQMAVSQVEANLDKEKNKVIKGESKVQAEIRRKMIDGVAKHLTHLIKDAAQLGLTFNVDRKEGRLTGDMTFSGKPGSELAKEIADVGKTQSLFGGLVSSKAAINVLLHPVLPEDVRKAIEPAIDEGLKEGLAKEKNASKRERAEKVFKAIEPSLKAGELDLAISFRGPSKENHYTFVGALKLKEGEKVDQALQDLAKTAPERDQKKIHFEAETSGDFKIHKLDAQGDLDEKTRAILGKHPIYLAFRSDAVFVSGGARGLETIKEALTAEPKTAPTGLLEVSMSHLAPLILAESLRMDLQHLDSETVKNIRKKFEGDNDKIRLTIEGGKVLKASFVMGAPVIKFLEESMGIRVEKTFGKDGKEIKAPKKKPKKEEQKKQEDK